MAHIRKRIRDKVKELLVTVPDIGDNILYDDPATIDSPSLPMLAILTAGESIENLTIGFPRLQRRSMQLDFVVVVKQTTGLQDKLDEICSNVENIMSNNIDLNGLISYLSLRNIDFEFNDDQDKYMGTVKMEYDFTYDIYENEL